MTIDAHPGKKSHRRQIVVRQCRVPIRFYILINYPVEFLRLNYLKNLIYYEIERAECCDFGPVLR